MTTLGGVVVFHVFLQDVAGLENILAINTGEYVFLKCHELYCCCLFVCLFVCWSESSLYLSVLLEKPSSPIEATVCAHVCRYQVALLDQHRHVAEKIEIVALYLVGSGISKHQLTMSTRFCVRLVQVFFQIPSRAKPIVALTAHHLNSHAGRHLWCRQIRNLGVVA